MNKTIALLLLIALFGVAAWYFFTAQPAAVHELPAPQIAPLSETQPEPESEPYIAPSEPEVENLPEPLPELNASDDSVKQALVGVVGQEALAGYLVKNEVISRFVATLDSLTSRQVPSQINPLLATGGHLKVTTEGERTIMSPANFSRYDGYVDVLKNLDNDALMAEYHRFYPLIQQAWEENGGKGSFNRRFVEVINNLLETPDVAHPIYLYKPEAVYLFEDPQLESLTAGQKIMVRMGSVNAAVVKNKIEDLSHYLVED